MQLLNLNSILQGFFTCMTSRANLRHKVKIGILKMSHSGYQKERGY